MVESELLLSLLGLALLDSLNPATLAAVALILLSAPKNAGLIALSSVLGAVLTVFAVGVIIFLSAGAASNAIDGISLLLSFLAFGAAGLILIISGFRRFKERQRKPPLLPLWFTPAKALPFGALLSVIDLPNAFPYFIAIERLITENVSQTPGLYLLLGYSIIYGLPSLILLIVGVMWGERTRVRLQKLVERLGSGKIKRSVPIAIITIFIGLFVASIPFILL